MFGAVGDLLVFLCGCREYDELILADILAALAKIITTLCKQGNKGQTATEAVGTSPLISIGLLRMVMLQTSVEVSRG